MPMWSDPRHMIQWKVNSYKLKTLMVQHSTENSVRECILRKRTELAEAQKVYAQQVKAEENKRLQIEEEETIRL